MSVLSPITHALAAVLAAAHDTLTALGADPGAGLTWLLSLAAVTAVVRLALLPLTVHGVRTAHASARARPALRELTERYRGRRDAESLAALAAERREISAEHGLSPLGCLPLLLQLPVWFALYRLVSDAAGGHGVGAMSAGLVASLGGATLLGVRLAERGYAGGPAHLAVVAGLALTAAALSYLTQRFLVVPNIVTDGMPETMVRAQQVLPVATAAGLLLVAGAVPVALLAYWVCNNAWTLLQSAVVWRWFPTPGSPAAAGR